MPGRRAENFVCAICQREIDMRWGYGGRGSYRTVPPLCRSCEEHYGQKTKLPHGSFMDRRKMAQIGALAEALSGVARCMQWSARHGRA